MKKILVVLFVFIFQISEAAYLTSFEEAQKIALATNKLIIIDFTASWCGPCKQMDRDTWGDEKVKVLLENFIFVKIDIDLNKDLASKYNVKSIPNVFVVDGNGAEVYNSLGYKGASQFINIIERYAISTEYLSKEMIAQYKLPGYYNSIKVAFKYFEFSLFLDDEIKQRFLSVSNHYLAESKKYLSKKEENYIEKKQKLELINLYYYAYKFNFDKLDKNLSEFKIDEIHQNNLVYYWFLKYITSKRLNKEDLNTVKNEFESIENFDYMNAKATLLLNTFEEKDKQKS